MPTACTAPTAPAVAWTVGSVRRGRAALPLLVCVLYAVLQLAAGPQWTLFPDSYRYARAAEQYLGASRQEAHRTALTAYCASRADRTAHDERLQPTVRQTERAIKAAAERECLDRWADAKDITTADPRYQAIFSTRPGYPLLAAPFVGAFGVLHGMRLLGLLTAAAGSLLVFGLLRGAGLSRRAGVVGQVTFLATPLGWWSAQALGEGLFTVCTLGVLWGGFLLIRRRRVPAAAAITALSYAAAAVTRYSSVLVLAALLAAAAVGSLCFSPGLRHRGTVVFAGLSAAAAGGVAVAMRTLDLPSSQVTLQDTFTRHFSAPEVSDPWGALLGLAGRFWRDWFAEQAAMPYFLLLTALAAWALATYGDGLGRLALATAATGACLVTAHPLVQESDRLGVLMWMPVVLGLPLVVDRHRAMRQVRELEIRCAGAPYSR
ncbi:hypothetical protein ABZY09_05165 [Streptomyces sp. NPDC002928]|uniref:hypothetical protein n=1 Tax=Streptomyces sp. NPDC002928 TaxID=3154440 RepID=UPI0033A011FE